MTRVIFTAISLIFLMSSCGGGDNSNHSKPPERKVTSISGTVFNAPISGSTITVWEFQNGTLGRKLGQTSSDVKGKYSLDVVSSSMPVIIKADGGAYLDPYTKEMITASNGKTLSLSSVANLIEGSTQAVMLTPLTHMMAAVARYNIKKGKPAETSITEALFVTHSMYGFDVNTTTPVDITKGGHSSYATQGHQYGAALTAYSSYAHDLINKYPSDQSATLYTSIYLSDLQYEDVLADGVLDGLGLHEVGIEKELSFGLEAVTTDMYSWSMAQHMLIVVNNPLINLSGTPPNEYLELAEQINQWGTDNGVRSILAARKMKALDTEPPRVTHQNKAVLVGRGIISLKLDDEIGVKDLRVSLEYQENVETWIEASLCSEIPENDDCALDKALFMSGLRETSVGVIVNTRALDEKGVKSARLMILAEDILENKHSVESPTYIPFLWDNTGPVIHITSSPTINAGEERYQLSGTVEDANEIVQISVTKNNDDAEVLECRNNPLPSETYKCTFSQFYDTGLFGNKTSFFIKALDNQGNESNAELHITKDNTPPNMRINYPDGVMQFIDTSTSNETLEDYTENTFYEGNVSSTNKHLKVDFEYASSGLPSDLKDDFKSFNTHIPTLNSLYIPYLSVTVSDPVDESESLIGSSAQKLKLSVSYWVKPPKSDNYEKLNSITSSTYSEGRPNTIPHESLVDNASQVTYYIPYVKELFGSPYTKVQDGSSQKLEIQIKDTAGNVSAKEIVYFKSTFNLPTFDIITPFINANAELSGLDETSGEFKKIDSCKTNKINDQRDVAGCELNAGLSKASFFNVKLTHSLTEDTHYYQWSDDASKKSTVYLNNGNIGAYFSVNNKDKIYITELSNYHTGLFDYLWDQKTERTKTEAEKVLAQVNNTLAGAKSFFTFDPITTRYATNVDISSLSQNPSTTNNLFLHRFILESFVELSAITPIRNSVDFASAFYQDFLHDGVANGLGKDNLPIKIDDYSLSEKTYRQELALKLDDLLTNKYNFSPIIALGYADILATANPSITFDDGDEHYIFGANNPGTSIDTSAPEISTRPNEEQTEGAYYIDNSTNKYISGKVGFTVNMTDPSGFKEAPKWTTKWYSSDGKAHIDNTSITEQKPITLNDKTYSFAFNSKADEFKEIAYFSLEAVVSDGKGNAYAESNPYNIHFKVDNAFPDASYIPQEGTNADTFHNINKPRTFTFSIEDTVGDLFEKRALLFTSSEEGIEPLTFTHDKFINTKTKIEFSVCRASTAPAAVDCPEGMNSLSDGTWTAHVIAEDNLKNKRTKEVAGFSIKIDATAPSVEKNINDGIFSGNKIWDPMDIISSFDGSPLKHIDVWHQAENSRKTKIEPCVSPLETEACITGTQPDIRVQLHFKKGAKSQHQLFVKASDTAIPANVSEEGSLNFTLDVDGPDLVLNSPWASDSLSGSGFVLGKRFDVKFTSISDFSGVQNITLYQKTTQGEIKIKESLFSSTPIDPHSINIQEEDANKIQLTEGESSEIITFYLKALDVHGFESRRDLSDVRIDRNGPELSLKEHVATDFYYTLEGYPFTLDAKDYDGTSLDKISETGVKKESIRYWTLQGSLDPSDTGLNPSDKQTLIFRENESGVMRVKASNIRGIESIKTFDIKVDNEKPEVSYSLAYSNGSPINDGNVTLDGAVELKFDVTDISGVRSPKASYQYDNQTPVPLPVVKINALKSDTQKTQSSQWGVILSTDNLAKDGLYQIHFEVEDKVNYPQTRPSNPNSRVISFPLNVQRQGVILNRVNVPSHFEQYTSPKTLKVQFEHTGTAKLTSLECWIRESNHLTEVPNDTKAPYVIVKNLNSQPYGCTLDGDKTLPFGATLITRTTAENGAQEISFHPFNGLDAKGPQVLSPSEYQLTPENAGVNENSGQLILDIEITDDLSGLLTETNKPVLKKGHKTYPGKCESKSKNSLVTTCTFKGPRNELTPPTEGINPKIEIGSLEDKLGNKSASYPVTLSIPQGDLKLDIISPATGTALNGRTLKVEFRYQVYEHSNVVEYIARLGTLPPFSSKDKEHLAKFSDQITCSDDVQWMCSSFNYELPFELENNDALNIEISIVDSWDKRKSEYITINIDNTKPTLSHVVFSPSHAKPETSVSLTATFSEKVTEPSGTLQNNQVLWRAQNKTSSLGKIWQGSVLVPSVDKTTETLNLSLNDYHDQAGNIGERNNTNTLFITPEITIYPIDTVNIAMDSKLLVSGTSSRFVFETDTLTLVFTDKNKKSLTEALVVSSEKWIKTVNLAGLVDGEIKLTVNGTNKHGVPAVQASASFLLDTTQPEINESGMMVSPAILESEKESEITLVFSSPVKDVSASLGGKSVVFEGEDARYKTHWSGKVLAILEADKSTLPLTVNAGFTDEAGNVGIETSAAFKIKPVLTLNPLDNDILNFNEASALVFSGKGLGFNRGDKIEITLQSEINASETKRVFGTLAASGLWNTEPVNISSWQESHISIRISGSNGIAVPFETLNERARLVTRRPDIQNVIFSKAHATVGEMVSVDIIFSEAVTQVGAKLGNVQFEIWKMYDDGKKWTGTGKMPDFPLIGGKRNPAILEISDYIDRDGNEGEINVGYSLAYSQLSKGTDPQGTVKIK